MTRVAQGHPRASSVWLRVVVAVALASFLSWPAGAAARDRSMTSQMLAEKLFQEGKQSLAEGRVAEACTKLADSQRLDPAGGTVLLLGLCLEQQGKLASAWSTLNDAIGYAERDGRVDRRDRARVRLQAIEPRLPKLSLELPRSQPEGLRLALDGTDLPKSAWQTALPVDPGTHRVTMSAPDHEPQVVSFTAVEALESRVALAEPLPQQAKGNSTSASVRRDVGITTLVLGGAVVVAGIIAGATALRWDDAADSVCPETTCSDANAAAKSRQAESAAHVTNWMLGIGAALGVTGTVLVWTAPSPASPDVSGARTTGRAIHAMVTGSF